MDELNKAADGGWRPPYVPRPSRLTYAEMMKRASGSIHRIGNMLRSLRIRELADYEGEVGEEAEEASECEDDAAPHATGLHATLGLGALSPARAAQAAAERAVSVCATAKVPSKRGGKAGKARAKAMAGERRGRKRPLSDRAFDRVVRQVTEGVAGARRLSAEAMAVLRFSCEDYAAGLFDDANTCMRHAQRKTMYVQDLALAARLRHGAGDQLLQGCGLLLG